MMNTTSNGVKLLRIVVVAELPDNEIRETVRGCCRRGSHARGGAIERDGLALAPLAFRRICLE